MVRTIEQILGIQSMNPPDATATPMYDCFNEQLVKAGYEFVPDIIPLNKMNKNMDQLKGGSKENGGLFA